MDKYIKVGIGVMILDGNKILLGHRAKDKKDTGGIYEVDCWTVPGGKQEYDETFWEGAKREVKEETNLDVEIIGEKSYRDQYITKKGMKEVVYFIAKKIGGELKPQIKEIQEIKWVNYPYALKYITYKTTKEIFKKFLEEEIEFL